VAQMAAATASTCADRQAAESGGQPGGEKPFATSNAPVRRAGINPMTRNRSWPPVRPLWWRKNVNAHSLPIHTRTESSQEIAHNGRGDHE